MAIRTTGTQKMFLFQIGSIRSETGCNATYPTFKFLFQIGSIRRHGAQILFKKAAEFLFQIGSIRSQDIRQSRTNRATVSIPNWFD